MTLPGNASKAKLTISGHVAKSVMTLEMSKVGQVDLIFVYDHGSSVGLFVQDYSLLCLTVMICVTVHFTVFYCICSVHELYSKESVSVSGRVPQCVGKADGVESTY